MMKTDAIVFDISSHCFGHLAQTAPVVERLRRLRPDLRIVVRTRHPPDLVRQFVDAVVDLDEPPPEATMVAPDATSIDLEASARAYASLHAKWEPILRGETERLARLRPVAVVSNINPMSLAAARRLGVPGVAMCCMNWADVYSHYFGDRPEAACVIGTMTEAYSGAEVFLQPRPHMAMAQLRNRRSIGPICREGRNLGRRLRRVLGLDEDARIILLTLGGFASPDAMDLPVVERGRWLVRGPHPAGREDVTAIETLGLSVLDLTFSADLVVCKDSYCSIVEAARAGTRMVIVPRPDWPETDCLVEWAERRCTVELAPGGLADGRALGDRVRSALARPTLPPVRAGGVEEAIAAIEAVCGLHAASRRPSCRLAAARDNPSGPSGPLSRARRAV